MRLVGPALFTSFCSLTDKHACLTASHSLDRVKDGTKTAFEWIKQQRHVILAATGLTLGLVALAAGEALTYLPLTILMIGLGALGMLRQHLARKALKAGEERLEKLQKSHNDYKAKLPKADRSIQTLHEMETFANEIAAESTSFQKILKDNSAVDVRHFQARLSHFVTNHEFYKNHLRALQDNPERRGELEWTQHAYRNFAQLFLTKIQLEAQSSIDREASWVKMLRKRAERA